MRNTIFKKSPVYGTIILLIGLSTITSINGNNVETNNQLNNAYPSYANLLYDDYISSYWKFDTGSGNTLYDSSGNDYDGTIYGASWVTGHSGYALDFDGLNDYVSLDEYAVELGFNKTDDLIFSLWFKSTTNKEGLIYSMSQSWDYNPGFHIGINSDGELEFKIWVLSCGVDFSTESNYNDGEWHYAEIWYNGISANPTITIYVDGEEDVTITHWICNFEYEEFARNKIGRTSLNQTRYFDGTIDELKVIKFPGGNEQNPPEISGPETGVINQDIEFNFVTNDPEEDDVEIFIDWGDGTDTGWIGPYESGEEVIKSHKYSQNGEYSIGAQSRDIWHHSSWSHHTIRIGNQIPSAPIIKGPTYGEPQSSYDFTFNSNDYEGDNVWYWIEWGDGDIEEWIGDPDGFPSGQETKVTHIWQEKGIYEIKAKAKDEYDRESDMSTMTLRIGNEAPNTPSIKGQTSGEIDVEYEYTFISTDPDGDNLYYWIKWGDGTHVDHFGPYASGAEVKLKHTWHNRGTTTIKAQAEDEIHDFSKEGQLSVTMPKSKGFYFKFILLEWILERFPHSFPILRHLIGL